MRCVTYREVFERVQQEAEGKLSFVQQRLRLRDAGQSRAEDPADETHAVSDGTTHLQERGVKDTDSGLQLSFCRSCGRHGAGGVTSPAGRRLRSCSRLTTRRASGGCDSRLIAARDGLS